MTNNLYPIEEGVDNPYPIEEHTFNAWLNNKNSDDYIGTSNSRHHCMFATFLEETYHNAFSIMYDDDTHETASYWLGHLSQEWQVPAWAMPKMRVFDNLYEEREDVVKWEFLEALENSEE